MQNLIHSIESFDSIGGHSYTTWSGGEGVHEMTMNDHEGEGFRNDHVVRWQIFFVYVFFLLHEFSI